MTFDLAPELKRDCEFVLDMDLCQVHLLNDKRFPWLVLVPTVPEVTEVFDLEEEDQVLLTLEVNFVAKVLKDLTGCTKINIGSLGNMVSQLHMHVVARNADDCAWPGPVWGAGQAVPYSETELKQMKADLQLALDYD
ncbi:MAG: HIT family protein [Alphaproteobacteria bacterium]